MPKYVTEIVMISKTNPEFVRPQPSAPPSSPTAGSPQKIDLTPCSSGHNDEPPTSTHPQGASTMGQTNTEQAVLERQPVDTAAAAASSSSAASSSQASTPIDQFKTHANALGFYLFHSKGLTPHSATGSTTRLLATGASSLLSGATSLIWSAKTNQEPVPHYNQPVCTSDNYDGLDPFAAKALAICAELLKAIKETGINPSQESFKKLSDRTNYLATQSNLPGANRFPSIMQQIAKDFIEVLRTSNEEEISKFFKEACSYIIEKKHLVNVDKKIAEYHGVVSQAKNPNKEVIEPYINAIVNKLSSELFLMIHNGQTLKRDIDNEELLNLFTSILDLLDTLNHYAPSSSTSTENFSIQVKAQKKHIDHYRTDPSSALALRLLPTNVKGLVQEVRTNIAGITDLKFDRGLANFALNQMDAMLATHVSQSLNIISQEAAKKNTHKK